MHRVLMKIGREFPKYISIALYSPSRILNFSNTRSICCARILRDPIGKKPIGAFPRYVKEVYHETSQLEVEAKTPRVLEIIANRWRTMSDENKRVYFQAYEEEREEWVKKYENSTDDEKFRYEEAIKTKRIKKQKRAPRKKFKMEVNEDHRDVYKKINSMAIYQYERYYSLRREYPKHKQQELFKMMAYEWKNLDEDSKNRFKDLALAMREKSSETILKYTFMELYDQCYIPRPGEGVYY